METQWSEKKPDPTIVSLLEKELGCQRVIATLLANRDIKTPEAALAFLSPSLTALTNPFALKDMDRAVERIILAIENKERILIFGDFDADGVTATAVLNDFLTHVNGEVSWYIPHRIREGYSLKVEHIAMAVEQQIDLIITVDCGSDSFEAVDFARREDIDIIVTDHHEVPDPSPEVLAIVNPKQKKCPSGLDHLAGVGVAFYLVIALRMEMRKRGVWENISEPNLITSCDLVALGTIADMVPLTAENRILTMAGIQVMREGRRPGLKALVDVARINPALLDSEDVAFRIAPRINAAGRISHARICIDLLCSKDTGTAQQKAEIIDQFNRRRQQTEQSIVADIEQRILRRGEASFENAIVMWDSSWNPGVMGIAASKTAKKYACPVVLISTANTPATGSCRSVDNINIHTALEQCSALLERFGGHAMAAGLTIHHEQIDEFSRLFQQTICSMVDSQPRKKILELDCALEIDSITEDLIQAVDSLRPFGMGNPDPLFYCTDVTVINSTTIGLSHRKMELAKHTDPLGPRITAMHFNVDDPAYPPTHFERIAFRVRMNHFNGSSNPQIIIEQA
ncbi:MAG: single-stranded-DNA-specific exonuclease RecJ [Desulfobacterium sp.]|jgi:single-stranded-DNA-specific exonuclease|nr:single-stranded-DNA-specific exonuclease RecJ [Desulfobacterium sp.]